MGKVSRVAPHLSLVEIQERIHQTTGFWKVKKWLVIWHATVDPSSAKQIALHTGLAEQTVHNLIALYNRCGPDVVEGKGKGGRRRAYLTEREEIRFLEKYRKRAAKGELVTVWEIKRGFEKVVGRMVHKSTISRLLKRHGWRNVVPRPRHVEADPLEQETFKKNLF